MTPFLAELGKKLAEKWVTLLVLPGLVYLACVSVAAVLGHGRALDAAPLHDAVNRVAARPASASPGAVLLTVTGVLAASGVAGLAAAALGRGIERVWAGPGRRWPARLLVRRRGRRWDEADARVRREITAAVRARPAASADAGAPAAEVAEAVRRRNALGLTRPQRPTWIGDRLYTADQRVHAAYDLDLAAVWPRLWLILPDQARADLTSARDDHAAAARLAGWALLYLPIAWFWWPAAVVAAIAAVTAWARARQTSAVLADLIESCVDLYGSDLAVRIGIPHEGPLTRDTGLAMTVTLRKDRESLVPRPGDVLPRRAGHDGSGADEGPGL